MSEHTMAPGPDICLEMDSSIGEEFVRFWNEQIEKNQIPRELPARFRPKQAAPGGFGFAEPATVIITTTLALPLLKGIATTLGMGIGTLLWTKLREFYRRREQSAHLTPMLVVKVGELSIEVDPSAMPPQAPETFQQLDGRFRHLEQ